LEWGGDVDRYTMSRQSEDDAELIRREERFRQELTLVHFSAQPEPFRD